MFFGWEGVGLASYLLIGFWYKKASANAAAIKAFVVNRVGDLRLHARHLRRILPVRTVSDPRRSFAAAPKWPDRPSASSGCSVDTMTCCACCCSSARWANRRS
jgi:NADH:ubiquinone oxidoreductase subunit 5 (subunit L)/multisubunit Na+/H+ antiporter MnhA subunit